MTKHVVSTLSAGVNYADWTNNNGMNQIVKSVLVNGGAGVAAGAPNGQTITAQGVVTHVTDEEARFLENHPLFKEHRERGFVKIMSVAKDGDSAAQSMSRNDGSRPKNMGDVEEVAKQSGNQDERTKLQAVVNKK